MPALGLQKNRFKPRTGSLNSGAQQYGPPDPMRILILDTYYPPFLSSLYARLPHLGSQPYAEQLRLILDQRFGTSDFYSSNLNKLGHEATEIIVNCEPLQRTWAAENGLPLDDKAHWSLRRRGQIPWPVRSKSSDWLYKVLARQISDYRPDVLYVQDMNLISDAFIAEMKSHCGVVVGQIACPIKKDANFRVYDFITCLLYTSPSPRDS